jgi:exonuclease VII large subunit
MELRDFEQWEIRCYFKIDKRIEQIKQHIKRLKQSFYDQTLTSRISYNGQEIEMLPFRIEINVIPFVDTIRQREETIQRLTKKKRYLNDYLNSLDPEEKSYLIDRYSKNTSSKNVRQADLNLFEEICEIEEAICFMYGFPVEILEKHINIDSLEEDFNAITALLGV